MRASVRLGLLTVAFLAAAIWLTWPLGRHLWDHIVDARMFGPDGAMWRQDVFLTIWIMAWGTHALTTDPTQLWHANILRPMSAALAGSENMLGYQWLFAPLYLTTGNPVFATQTIVLLTFVLTGVATALLVEELTDSTYAGWVAGCIVAFSPWRFGEMSRVNLLGTFYLPMIVLCLSRYLRSGRRRYLPVMSAALVLQALTSYYLGYFAFATIGLLLLPSLATRSLTRRQWLSIAAAVATAVAMLVPFSLPYVRLQAAGVIPSDPYADPMVLAFFLSARPWMRFFTPGYEVYLGATALALAAVGCRRLRRELWPGRAALLSLAMGGYVLALGPALPLGHMMIPLPYRILTWVIPGLSAVRYPMRFGLLVVLAVALLAGRGVAAIIALLPRHGWHTYAKLTLVAVASVAVMLEARTYVGAHVLVMPVPVGRSVPPVYSWLRTHGNSETCVEVPVGDDTFPGFYRESWYMYVSTYHWQPLINGFTGHPTRDSTEMRAVARELPDAAALATLRAHTHLRWVIVHLADLSPPARAMWQNAAATWRTAAQFGSDIVFDVSPQ